VTKEVCGADRRAIGPRASGAAPHLCDRTDRSCGAAEGYPPMIIPPPLRPGMLPPSPDPLPMPDLKDGESCWYEPPVRPQEGESGYWRLEDPHTSASTGTEWVNDREFGKLQPWYDEFYESPTLPHFLSKRPPPKKLGEYYRGLSHMVSERVVDIFRAFDPEGIKTIEINMEFKDGARPPYKFFWMHIVRKVAAIDYANSRVLYNKSPSYPADSIRFCCVRLMPEAYEWPYFCSYPSPGFRTIFVSDEMRQKLTNQKIRYIRFTDVSHPIYTF
jgi:hypothetical protein